MKIIINKDETYEVNIPESIGINQIGIIAERLLKLKKVFGQDIIMQPTSKSTKQIKRAPLKIDEAEAKELLKIYYDLSIPLEDRKKILTQKTGMEYRRFTVYTGHLRARYNLKREDFINVAAEIKT